MLQRNQKRKFQKIASAVFGIGIALLAGCSTAKPVVNASSPQKTYGIDWSEETGQKLPKSLSGRRVEGPTYGVHIIGNVYGSVWNMFILVALGKRTPFDSVTSPTISKSYPYPFEVGPQWAGIRGWVQVEKDGLHYFFRTRKDFVDQRQKIFRGILACEKDSHDCIVKFSTGSL